MVNILVFGVYPITHLYMRQLIATTAILFEIIRDLNSDQMPFLNRQAWFDIVLQAAFQTPTIFNDFRFALAAPCLLLIYSPAGAGSSKVLNRWRITRIPGEYRTQHCNILIT